VACFGAMRAGVVLIALVLVAAAASTADAARTSVPFWSTDKVLRKLDGDRVRVGSRRVRIDSDTTLCSGRGTSIRRNGIRMWRRFLCTYTTFTKAGVDRDLEFRVRVLGRIRYAVWDAHWVRPPV
jgi:hypothetical protein